MARNRVIYQSDAVFAAPTGSASLNVADNSLRRVQSCNYNFSIQRQDINQFGELAAIDRLIIQEPTVSVDLSYYFEPTGFNERHLGLRTNALTGVSSAADHMLDYVISSGTGYDQKNIFILTSDAGIDANDTSASAMGNSANYDGIIGIGNTFLTSWSLEAAVGGIPTVTCALEGQNIVFTGGISAPVAPNPSIVNGVDPGVTVSLPSGAGLFDASAEVAAVRPGDITLFLGTTESDDAPMVGLSETDLKIQSASVAMTINREPIRKLGNTFAFAREITFPINCTMSVNAIVGDLASKRLFSLVNRACDDATKYTAMLTINGYKGSSCSANTAYIILKGAKLDSQNITSSIGPNKSVTLELSAQIGKNSGLHFRSSDPANP
jgi:hypothetical protein